MKTTNARAPMAPLAHNPKTDPIGALMELSFRWIGTTLPGQPKPPPTDPKESKQTSDARVRCGRELWEVVCAMPIDAEHNEELRKIEKARKAREQATLDAAIDMLHELESASAKFQQLRALVDHMMDDDDCSLLGGVALEVCMTCSDRLDALATKQRPHLTKLEREAAA